MRQDSPVELGGSPTSDTAAAATAVGGGGPDALRGAPRAGSAARRSGMLLATGATVLGLWFGLQAPAVSPVTPLPPLSTQPVAAGAAIEEPPDADRDRDGDGDGEGDGDGDGAMDRGDPGGRDGRAGDRGGRR